MYSNAAIKSVTYVLVIVVLISHVGAEMIGVGLGCERTEKPIFAFFLNDNIPARTRVIFVGRGSVIPIGCLVAHFGFLSPTGAKVV